jgi:hypothetical protein
MTTGRVYAVSKAGRPPMFRLPGANVSNVRGKSGGMETKTGAEKRKVITFAHIRDLFGKRCIPVITA